MRLAVLYDENHSHNKLEKKNLKIFSERFECKKVRSTKAADTIIYFGDFSTQIQELNMMDKLVHLIPYEKLHFYEENISLSTPKNAKLLKQKHFNDESVHEVVKNIEYEIDNIDLEEHFSDLGRYLKMISIELVQNGIIFKREQNLASNETPVGEVNFKIYETEDFFEIIVTDCFGALDYERVKKRLAEVYKTKTYENKKEGAGFGLYMVLSYSDDLCFEVSSQKQTKVTSRIYKYKRLKEFKQKKTAIHFLKV